MLGECSRATLALLLVVAYCHLSGAAAMRLIRPAIQPLGRLWNRPTECFLVMGLGLALLMPALFGLALAGGFHPRGILLGAAALSMASMAILHTRPAPAPVSPPWRRIDGLVALALLLTVLLSALHPPGHWDDTMYHLPLARSCADRGTLVMNPFLRFPLTPQNMNLLFGLGLLLGGDVAAQALATLPLALTALGLVGLWLGLTASLTPGLLAATALYFSGPVRHTLGFAYVDNGLAMFCWGAGLALAFWTQTAASAGRSRGWLVMAGLLAGAAAGTKLLGLVFAGLPGLYLLGRRADRGCLLAYGVPLGLAGLGWYARAGWLSGDPFHPMGGPVLGYFLWDAGDMAALRAEQATHGVTVSSLNVVAALGRAGAAPLWLALASLLPSRTSIPPALRVLRWLFFPYLLFWFLVAQVDRYLAPILPIGMVLATHALHRVKWPGTAALAPLLGLAAILALAGSRCVPTQRSWQAALGARPGHAVFRHANALMPAYGNRVVQIGFENGIDFFRGTAIGDWFGPGRYRAWLNCDDSGCALIDPARMKEVMGGFHARLLAISTARFRGLNVDAYTREFDLIHRDRFGILLATRTPADHDPDASGGHRSPENSGLSDRAPPPARDSARVSR